MLYFHFSQTRSSLTLSNSNCVLLLATGLIGDLFIHETEGAYAYLSICCSLGNIISYSISAYVCTSVKTYIILSFVALGTVGYYVVEIMTYKSRHKTKITTDNSNDTLQAVDAASDDKIEALLSPCDAGKNPYYSTL